MLRPVNGAIFPNPLPARPIEGFELLQVNVVPGTLPENNTGAVELRWHHTWSGTTFTAGTGFTVTVKEVKAPEQESPELVKTGVTVIVAVVGPFVRLVAVKDGISPDPTAASPMDVLELVQL